MSLGSMTIIVAVASVVITGIWCALTRHWSAGYIAIGVPLVVSFIIYWRPGDSQHNAWALIGVGVPFLAGVIPSSIIAALFGHRRGN
jgi:hypothetical protein